MLVQINDVPPFDGEYQLDLTRFNGRELHLIKKLAGVRGNEISDALLAADYDLLIAFALIAIERSGRKPPPAELLLEVDAGKIILADDPVEEAEGEERPPASSPMPSGNESSNGVGTRQSFESEPSGAPSSTTGAAPPSGPAATGSPGSETSAESFPVTDLEAAPI